MAENINSFEQLTISTSTDEKMWSNPNFDYLRRLRSNIKLRRRRSRSFLMDPEKFCREVHAFYKVIIGDFNAKVGPRRTPEDFHIGIHGLQWNEQEERLS
ncbi:hypothetical protein NECAME_18846 [Necator americanus]|uniref:Endonuclease/exonuclease/phosphatase domain-containing protein n=1 Tax=Necator americanus TaxID=51031 RepID=W2SSF8_NECAM|nr:hypothetical protein NECAME_18846 [Necator americanus]ETN72443.1 hypothetical protein NECAME_18846 [Necator americanus]